MSFKIASGGSHFSRAGFKTGRSDVPKLENFKTIRSRSKNTGHSKEAGLRATFKLGIFLFSANAEEQLSIFRALKMVPRRPLWRAENEGGSL
jgi:hypothetical protein